MISLQAAITQRNTLVDVIPEGVEFGGQTLGQTVVELDLHRLMGNSAGEVFPVDYDDWFIREIEKGSPKLTPGRS